MISENFDSNFEKVLEVPARKNYRETAEAAPREKKAGMAFAAKDVIISKDAPKWQKPPKKF